MVTTRPLRIALVTPEFPDCGPAFGVGRYVADLAMGLKQAGQDVTVLVCTPQGRWHIDQNGSLHADRRRRPALAVPLDDAAWLDRHLHAGAFDIVEFSNWGGLAAWIRWPGRVAVRVSTPVGLIPTNGLRRMARPWHRFHEQATVTRANILIADSQAMSDQALLSYGRRPQWVVHHGIEPGPAPKSKTLIPAAMIVGRMEHRKGIDLALSWWPAVRSKNPDAILHLIGADNGYLETISPSGLPPGIIHHGRVSDEKLADLRATVPLALVPSRFESFGIVVLEAWRAGQAIIGSTAGALPEVIGEAGMTLPLGANDAWTEAVLRHFTDPMHMAASGASGWQRLNARFTAEKMVEGTLLAYTSANDKAMR